MWPPIMVTKRLKKKKKKAAKSHDYFLLSKSSREIRASRGMGDEIVLRVSQLDAVELDAQLIDSLQSQFIGTFKFASLSQLNPELKLFLRWYLWKTSVHTAERTFGQQMLDLKYSLDGNKFVPLKSGHKVALFLMMVLGPWLHDRTDMLSSVLPHVSTSVIQTVLSKITSVMKIVTLLNFLDFLLKGRFPTLQDRVLGITLVPDRRQTLRQTSYDYMNREILWHGFAEFLFNVLPQFNSFAVKNWLRLVWRKLAPPRIEAECRPLQTKDFLVCRFCASMPTLPYVTNCGHIYCYYCITANCIADAAFPCCACGGKVEGCAPARLPDP